MTARWSSHPARRAVSVAALLLGPTLAACTGTTDASTAGAPPTAAATATAPPPSTTPAQQRRPTVLLGVTSAGNVVVDDRGRTLYVFDGDHPGQPSCSGRCLSVWLPAPAARPPVAGPGVTGPLGVTRATNGTRQLTIAGHPLYLYAGDIRAGDANGAGLDTFGGAWNLVSGAGTAVTRSRASAAPTPTPSAPYDFTT